MTRLLTASLFVSFASPFALAQVDDKDLVKPGPRPVDERHPAVLSGEPQPDPAYGGRMIVHLSSMPDGVNRAIENSAVTREMHHAMHESLVSLDWESWEYVPRLAESWETEDIVVLSPGAAARLAAYPQADGTVDLTERLEVAFLPAELEKARAMAREKGAEPDALPRLREVAALYGKVEGTAEDGLVLKAISPGNPLGVIGEIALAPEDIVQVELGTAFTFHLRDDVIWHPGGGVEGHRFDARDVYFSWSIYGNPEVDCDEVRFQFEKITGAEVLDDLTIRMFYEQQYYTALESVGVDMMMLPSHLYDLSDPDNPAFDERVAPGGAGHDPDEFGLRQAEVVNESEHNREGFVGLGPYFLSTLDPQYIECQRFEDYFAPEEGGYFDTIRFRLIEDDDLAWQALINGELDFFYRVKASYYFGPQTESDLFKRDFYKGYYYPADYNFTVWNRFQPHLAEREVRVALAMAFDHAEHLSTFYKGLARPITGPFPFSSNAYDHSIKPLPFDLEEAELMLEDAGWYDRNGNGIADKDGVELVIEFLMPAGNDASKTLAEKMQSSYSEIGVKLNIVELEWASFLEKVTLRNFDGASLAWVPSLESDPEQVWHSKWAPKDSNSSNFAGFANPEVDRLIELGQRELDYEKRQAIWRSIHALVYEDMPMLFGYNVPRKFGMNKAVRGFKSYAMRPYYNIRDWYYAAGTEGTRPTPSAGSGAAGR